jgi:hypothetical protein
LAALFVCTALGSPVCCTDDCGCNTSYSHAEAKRCHAGEVLSAVIAELIRLPGTQLIIAQQNIAGRITTEQLQSCSDFGLGG